MTPLQIAGIAAAAVLIALLLFAFRRAHTGRLSPAMLVVLRITLGIVFFILGIVGSLLPILQGWLFFLLSFLMLFPDSKWAVKILDKAERKMPRLVAWLRRMGIGRHREPHEETVRPRVL